MSQLRVMKQKMNCHIAPIIFRLNITRLYIYLYILITHIIDESQTVENYLLTVPLVAPLPLTLALLELVVPLLETELPLVEVDELP